MADLHLRRAALCAALLLATPTASVTPLANRPPAGVSAGFSIARAFAL